MIWRAALIAVAGLATPAMAEPSDAPASEVYVEGMAGLGGANQNLFRIAIGARLALNDGGLQGINARLGATAHLGNSQIAFSAVGVEAEGNYPLSTSLRLGLRAGAEMGTPAGGADDGSFLAVGAVLRYDVVALHVDAFRARPGNNVGVDNLAPRYGVMVGFGVAGNPHWYGWIALVVAGLAGAMYAGAAAGGG